MRNPAGDQDISKGDETSEAGWEELAVGLAEMARRLLAEPTVEATLSAIVEHRRIAD